jgi:hypothetical protein
MSFLLRLEWGIRHYEDFLCLLASSLCYYHMIMERHSFAIDINSFLPIILLLLFLVLPALLKRLGQYTAAGKDAQRPSEQTREAMPEERMHDYFEEPSIGDTYERTQKETFSNKPIHPKWF